MTYNVFGVTLSLTQSINQSLELVVTREQSTWYNVNIIAICRVLSYFKINNSAVQIDINLELCRLLKQVE